MPLCLFQQSSGLSPGWSLVCEERTLYPHPPLLLTFTLSRPHAAHLGSDKMQRPKDFRTKFALKFKNKGQEGEDARPPCAVGSEKGAARLPGRPLCPSRIKPGTEVTREPLLCGTSHARVPHAVQHAQNPRQEQRRGTELQVLEGHAGNTNIVISGITMSLLRAKTRDCGRRRKEEGLVGPQQLVSLLTREEAEVTRTGV